jgi:hypothetical protein
MANADNQEDQNNNQAASGESNEAYNQYIDPDFQKKQQKKKLWLILASSIAALVFIVIVVVIAATLSSDGDNKVNEAPGGTVNVVETCTTEECFNERFFFCQPTKYELSEGNNIVEYEIPGIQEVGCIVSLKNIDNEDKDIIGKEMSCDFDNELSFREALALVDEYPEDYECEGSLVDFYNGLEEEANLLYEI